MNLFKGLICASLCLTVFGCHGSSSPATTNTSGGGTVTSGPVSVLKIDDVKVGDGDTAAVGDTAIVEYTGKLANGVVFDTDMPADPAKPDKAPFSFFIAPEHGMVIQGWIKGVPGMKVGGERKLSVPAALAYGPTEHGQIPANSDLFFDIKLLALVKAGHDSDLGVKDIKEGMGPAVKLGDYVTISFTASLVNGLLAFTSQDHPPALQFQAGTGVAGNMQVPMLGVVNGVIGMKLGGERMLVCPPSLCQSPNLHGGKIPGDSILKFDVKLLRISSKMEPDMQESTQ